MTLHRVSGYVKSSSNLLIAQTVGDEIDDFPFALGQLDCGLESPAVCTEGSTFSPLATALIVSTYS